MQLIDNDDYYKSLLNFILRIIEERSCLYLKINSTCNTLFIFKNGTYEKINIPTLYRVL